MLRESLEKIKYDIAENGYFAQIRMWSLGETVVVGKEVEKTDMGIGVIKRHFYIVPRDRDSWYTLVGSIDTGEVFSLNTALEYALRVLAMPEDEYINEIGRRAKGAKLA